MPQFDPISFSAQLFWLLISLVILYGMISRFAIPRVADALEKRQRMIDDDLEQATRLERQSESAIQVYEAALAQARAQAQSSIKTVSEAASREAERRTAELSARLNSQIKEGEARIVFLRDNALSNVRSVAADVSARIVVHLTGVSTVDAAKAEHAVDAIVKEQSR